MIDCKQLYHVAFVCAFHWFAPAPLLLVQRTALSPAWFRRGLAHTVSFDICAYDTCSRVRFVFSVRALSLVSGVSYHLFSACVCSIYSSF